MFGCHIVKPEWHKNVLKIFSFTSGLDPTLSFYGKLTSESVQPLLRRSRSRQKKDLLRNAGFHFYFRVKVKLPDVKIVG